MTNIPYKLCILCAGKGSRITKLHSLHKAFLPIQNKPIISRIIDSIPNCSEIILATGYKSKEVDILASLIIKKPLKIVNVDNFDGPGSGPGYSLLQCSKYLQCPFIFTSVDTIIEENIDNLHCNWIGVSHVSPEESQSYCLVEQQNNQLKHFYYGKGTLAYIGIAGIHDYGLFWDSLRSGSLIKGEKQVTDGFQQLQEVKLRYLNWHDTGNDNAYEKTLNLYKQPLTLHKIDETISIDNDIVIKYFNDDQISQNRVIRSQILKTIVPECKQISNNIYIYKFQKGTRLSDIHDKNILREFWLHFERSFPICQPDQSFVDNCYNMYQTKSSQRINMFKNSPVDLIYNINGINVKPIQNIFNSIPWDNIVQSSIPSVFHGDLQPENILYNGKQFIFLDWRHSFGSSLHVGDKYYDLSKMLHACIISNEVIRQNQFAVKVKNDRAALEFNIKSNLIDLKKELQCFCNKHKYSWTKIQLLAAIHYINIAPLYTGEYKDFLFLYGKLIITDILNEHTTDRLI